MIYRSFITVILLCLFGATAFCQEVADTIAARNLSAKYINTVSSKLAGVEDKLSTATEKSLKRISRQEEKLKERLAKIDSTAAANLFNNSIDVYNRFSQSLKQKAERITQAGISNYVPYLDTLKNAIGFIQQHGERYAEKVGDLTGKLSDISNDIKNLEGRFDQLKNIQQYLKERRQYLKQQLTKYGMEKYLKKMSKEIYYAGQLVKDYKEILKDPKKIEQKALAILRESPAFKKFMQKNSMLASIFRIPGDNTSSTPSASLNGLQTRASVQQYIQTSLPISGSNSNQFLTQQLQNANSQMAAMKNLPQLKGFSDDLGDVPDFKPNSQKTKSFFKRLEYSINMQFGGVNDLMPTIADFSFGIGYKLNDNGLIGIGTSYKLGLGSGIKDIHFTHQGYGIRSYIDWQIKSGFYISGGYEKNNFPELRGVDLSTRTSVVRANPVQESGLIGITKKYPISKKAKGSAQLLFDFLSYKNIPKSQPVIVRFGWSF